MSKETKKSRAVVARKTPEVDPEKKKQLEMLEKQIHDGLTSYYAIGYALMQIRDGELYKCKDFTSFEKYCKETFNYSRSYGYRLIAYCKVRNIIADDKDTKIPEKTLRELAKFITKDKVDEEKIRQCWEEAKARTTDGIPDFDTVKEIVDEKRELICLEEEKTDSEASIYLKSIKAVVGIATIADDLISRKNKTYTGLYNAIAEAKKRKISFSEEDIEKLKQELHARQEAVINNLFTDNQ